MSSRDLGANSRRCKIATWGELLWDVFHERDRNGRLIGRSAHLGGSAANVAFHARRLGAEGFLISRVGGDELGRLAIEKMARAGIQTEGITVDSKHPTGTVGVEFHAGEPEFTIEPRVAWDHIDPPADIVSRLKSVDVLCVGTLAQRTLSARTRLRTVLRELGNVDANVRRPLIFVDLNLRAPFVDQDAVLEVIRLADLIKLNESELRWVARTFETDNPLRFLRHAGRARLVALTRGSRGASLYGHQVELAEPGHQVRGGDPVGAGDSFLAGLSVTIAQGTSLHRALECANRYASWVASQPGAMPDGVALPTISPWARKRAEVPPLASADRQPPRRSLPAEEES